MEIIFGVLFTWLITFFIYNNYKQKKKKVDLVDVDFNWVPEPLVSEKDIEIASKTLKPPLVVHSKVEKWVEVDGKRLLNFASHNYLGFVESEYITEEAKKAIYKYGVGSCGPRGFYGTVDVHLELESRLAKFMNMECAIVYSYGFSTIASAIAAYIKKHDVIFADEKVNFAIQRGMEASRAKVIYFKHNDAAHLEELLKSWYNSHKNKKESSKIRKFLIVEGLYINTGKLCPLPDLVEIRKRYKLRMFMDESVSFGVIGKSGRGVIEHFNVDPDDIDMVMASMEYSLSTGGGFCVGSAFVIEHQQLSGLGYCFSASLPPFLAVAARAGIDLIEEQPELLTKLSQRCDQLQTALADSTVLRNYYHFSSDACSPVKHMILKDNLLAHPSQRTYAEKYKALNDIVSRCKDMSILITTANYLTEREHFSHPASIRLTTSVRMSDEDIRKLIHALEKATKDVIIC